MLRVGFLHYHAKPGGVTKVIHQQMEALKDHAECLLLVGEGSSQGMDRGTRVVPGIGYDGERPDESPEETARGVLRAIEGVWPSGCDLLHVHNPLLKKNRDFLKVLNLLQQWGITLFLQIHDIAEDLRPGVYYSEEEYPENCHYGVINSRDFEGFLKAGLKPEGLHLLPNCVTPLMTPPPGQAPTRGGATHREGDLVLYPVRAIRRKNLGEAILISCLLPPPCRVGITLPPTSPSDYPTYEEWKQFVQSEGLPVEFELGLRNRLEDLLRDARYVLTTSVQEGFGFAFLEPWTAGKSLRGRRIPYIVGDFERQGLRFPYLYDRLAISADLLDLERVRKMWEQGVRETYAQYGLTVEDERLEDAWKSIGGGGNIDFPYLYADAMKELIRRCRGDQSLKNHIRSLNPLFQGGFTESEDGEVMERNRALVLSLYSLEKYRERLLSVYQRVLNGPVRHRIDRSSLLRFFLYPEGLFMVG